MFWKCLEFPSCCSGLGSMQLHVRACTWYTHHHHHHHQTIFHKGCEVAENRDYQRTISFLFQTLVASSHKNLCPNTRELNNITTSRILLIPLVYVLYKCYLCFSSFLGPARPSYTEKLPDRKHPQPYKQWGDKNKNCLSPGSPTEGTNKNAILCCSSSTPCAAMQHPYRC